MSLVKIYICDICGCQEPPLIDEDGIEWQPLSWWKLEDDKHACAECRETIPIGKNYE